MRMLIVSGPAVLLALALGPLFAQDPIPQDRPQVVETKPTSREEMARRQAAERVKKAQALYGLGVVQKKRDQLLEALRTFEEAANLDPDAAAPRRALVPIYLTLGRFEDATA